MALNFITKIQVLKNLEPIIMLSHMRANTSLFGHILGSNPEINGYYEMHMGYYSWKSFIRQKLKYLGQHEFKPNSKYIFDKVLHSEHYVNCNLFKTKNIKVILSLRSPKETIPSIIRLYKDKVDPDHEFSTIEGAVKYYKERLNTLNEYSEILKNNYIYLDANSIKDKTGYAFLFLEKELNLKYPLSKEYNIQEFTGIGSAGDHSETLKTGKISYKKNDYSDIKIDKDTIEKINNHYNEIRENIINNSKSYL